MATVDHGGRGGGWEQREVEDVGGWGLGRGVGKSWRRNGRLGQRGRNAIPHRSGRVSCPAEGDDLSECRGPPPPFFSPSSDCQ